MDAVVADCAEFDDAAPGGVWLDPLTQIEEQGPALTDWELWACASETLRQHGAKAPAFVAERIGMLIMSGDLAGVRAWQEIAARIDRLSRPDGERPN